MIVVSRNFIKLRAAQKFTFQHFKLLVPKEILRMSNLLYLKLNIKGFDNFNKKGNKVNKEPNKEHEEESKEEFEDKEANNKYNENNNDKSKPSNTDIEPNNMIKVGMRFLMMCGVVCLIFYQYLLSNESKNTQEEIMNLIKKGKVKSIKRKGHKYRFYGNNQLFLGVHSAFDMQEFEELLRKTQLEAGVKIEDLMDIKIIDRMIIWRFIIVFFLLYSVSFILLTRKTNRVLKNYNPKNLNKDMNDITEMLKQIQKRAVPGFAGETRATEYGEDKKIDIRFKDVAGMEGPKEEIQEFVEFLKNPKKFEDLGAKIPKGALLCGPPGTGKTLLAKACAGEAQVPFFVTSGSEFIEMYAGVGAARVRDLFRKAKEKSPCIIFIDEIDAIGKHRSKMGFNDEREATLNQIFVEMDGFKSDANIVVFAATNQKDSLDKALIRPGRFDRIIEISLPSLEERESILNVHLKKLNIKEEKKEVAKKLAALTMGMSGAELASICNEAAILAARHNKKNVEIEDFYEAFDRVLAGLKRKLPLKPKDKEVTAYHEAGHAIIGWYLKHAQPVLKVSIVPRSKGSLGHTITMPGEIAMYTRQQLEDMICTLYGGRASEEIFLKSITTGAQDDIQKATQLAKAYVGLFGMTNEFNCIAMLDSSDGMGGETRTLYSSTNAEIFDKLVNELCEKQYERAKELLNAKNKEVNLLAKRLLEKETIELNDLNEVLGARSKS